MPLPGRKPAPKALRILRGDRACRINAEEPEAPPANLEPPAWLGDGVARDKWAELVPLLVTMGVLTDADRDSLSRYCVCHEAWLKAVDACRRGLDILIHRDESGRIKNAQVGPHHTIMRRLGAELDRIACEFGMTPSSRTRLKGSAGVERSDPLSQWLRDNPVEARA